MENGAEITQQTSAQQVQPDPISVKQNLVSIPFLDIFNVVGFSTIVLALLYIGRKLQILDELKTTTDKIKANIKVVSDFLTRHDSKFNPTELQAYSPLKLTEIGRKFLEDIGFANIFGNHEQEFFSYIDAEHPTLKYDVETTAIKSIYALWDREYMNPIKQYLYNHPDRNLENTAPTLGVYVRDKYLEGHKQIMQ